MDDLTLTPTVPKPTRYWIAFGTTAALIALAATVLTIGPMLEQHTPTAVLKFSGVRSGSYMEGMSYQSVFRQSQARLIKSTYVISAALRRPGISQISLIEAQSDPVEWLRDELEFEFPEDETILRISLRSKEPQDAVALINAVTEAYFEAVVDPADLQTQMRFKLLKPATLDEVAEPPAPTADHFIRRSPLDEQSAPQEQAE